MQHQTALVRRFKSLYQNPTLKEVSELSGIQLTRVHRIFSGKEMRLQEFLIFERLVLEKEGPKFSKIKQFINESIYQLGPKGIDEICRTLRVQLLKQKLIQNSI